VILIVLASGRGKRLGSLTKNSPKCLITLYKNYTIIDQIKKNFKLFKKVIIITGYKSEILRKKLKLEKVEFVNNKNYLNTNMVESMMLAKKKAGKNDIVVTYSDIFYDEKIIKKLIKKKGDVLPLNRNWLKSWKNRYGKIKNIKKDAEDIVLSNGLIKSIGGKIKKRLPKYQFMGIIKIENKTFKKLSKFYNIVKNKKISLTEFINLSIISQITKYKYICSRNYWYEVDNNKDLAYLKNDIDKLF